MRAQHLNQALADESDKQLRVGNQSGIRAHGYHALGDREGRVGMQRSQHQMPRLGGKNTRQYRYQITQFTGQNGVGIKT